VNGVFMRFIPYHRVGAHPNIIVDCLATNNTILTLSHWPKSCTPEALKGDTSAEIAFRYLDLPEYHVKAEAVSNNHFDEDGLIGIFVLLHPEFAQNFRELLIDVAQAGDFGVYKNLEAARIAFTISALADRDTSPLDPEIFKLPYPGLCGELYIHLHQLLEEIVMDLKHYQKYWQDEDEKLALGEELIQKEKISIEDIPELDMAVIRMKNENTQCHPMAIHSHTSRTRLVFIMRNHFELQYRYESWVQLVSRKVGLRVDLSPFAKDLNREEKSPGHWEFEGVNNISPRLYFQGKNKSSLDPEYLLVRLKKIFETGVPAWNPFD